MHYSNQNIFKNMTHSNKQGMYCIYTCEFVWMVKMSGVRIKDNLHIVCKILVHLVSDAVNININCVIVFRPIYMNISV